MSDVVEIKVPDIGDFTGVPVIEVLIKPGDTISKDDSLIVLESDKASMEVPSTVDGTVQSVTAKIGDKVSQGTVIATVAVAPGGAIDKPTPAATQDEAKKVEQQQGPPPTPQPAPAASQPIPAAPQPPPAAPQPAAAPPPAPAASQPSSAPRASSASPAPVQPGVAATTGQQIAAASQIGNGEVHATPAVRRFARELGVALNAVTPSGPNGRITYEDVQTYVKGAMQSGASAAGGSVAFAGLPAWPQVDFAQYGEIERKPLSRIKKLSGPNLHRNWLQIPHITNYDEADITDLEAFRHEINTEQKQGGVKLTILAFLVRAAVAALRKFPEFNSSLDGDALVLKKYYNIGFAADTPNGLVVPVIKNADTKGLLEIGRESAELAAKARDGKLGLGDMQGGTFTISSIGGIGGTQFTQIVNAPEVAILGATRSTMKPVWNGTQFVPRLILPISVSYDHRVIDGASAARFLVYIANVLKDFRRTTL